jgi:putative glutamine amidotransferase
MGGSIQNLKEAGKTIIEHRVENREEVQHQISVIPKSLLYCIVKKKNYGVNSNHRNGIDRLSDKFVVTARAPDNVIEAFEAPHKMFFMGVMWHPEFALTKEDKALWQAFVLASASYSRKKTDY